MEATMYSLRILSKGKIKDLSKGFRLPDGVPFSVFVRSKKPTMDSDIVIQCKLIGDQASGEFPVPVGDWTPGAIVSINPNAIDLKNYDVFWGSGETNVKVK